MDNDVQQKLARSLTAESSELLQYLPYLLQDLWELGSDPQSIISALRSCGINERWSVLDLGCGKGAVSVKLAKEFGCRVKGIDLMKEFISYAITKANEWGTEQLCEFAAGDINEAARSESGYDAVILGAVGSVMGRPDETLAKLKAAVKPGGYIIIDDGYIADEAGEMWYKGEYYTKEQWLHAFSGMGMKLVSETQADNIESVNDSNTAYIAARAAELALIHPERRELFEHYVVSQQQESEDMLDRIVSAMWVLGVPKKP